MQLFFDVVLVVAGSVVALASLYLLVLAVAALFYRGYRAKDAAQARSAPNVAVLVPAHNEAALIGRCVRSLQQQTYEGERYEIIVIADNCSDTTAAVARAAGAEVLVRTDPDARGKGHALRWATDEVLGRPVPPDAIAVVDADSVAEPTFLATLAKPFEDGSEVVQGESLLFDDGSSPAVLRAAAFLLVNRVRAAGRAVLGMPCNLSGTGMLISRDVLTALPWDAYTSAEDVEYFVRLRVAGVAPAFAGGAIVRSPAAPNDDAALQQQLRWEGGKFHLMRTKTLEIVAAAVRARRPSLLLAAVELLLPPLGFLVAAAVLGGASAAVLAWLGVVSWWAVLPWLVAAVGIPLYVLVGLRAGHAPGAAYRSLAAAPLLVGRKLARLPRLAGFNAGTWVRTERLGDRVGRDAEGDPR
jgi:cellulose synthase/poly-beta-1,6-N-acetylglucosamine synthase-like glycosyltransferase